MLPVLVFLVLLFSPVSFVLLFNRMVEALNRVEGCWAGVDVALKRRADVTASLVEAVRGYAGHETEALVRASRARSSIATSNDTASTSGMLRDLEEAIADMLLLVEAYPDLKAAENFLDLQEALATSEKVLLAARQEYNEAVREFNTMRESLPTNVLARVKRFAAREYFHASPESGDAPTLEIRPQRQAEE